MGHQYAEESKGDVLRLSRALQSGTGHVAVIAEDRATARAEARKALVHVEAAAVLHVSSAGVESPADAVAAGSDESAARARVRSLMAPLLAQARAVQKPAFIVVDDADAADGAALERIRIVVECAPDAIPWLRIVLVGGDGLERALKDPAASALASRLCARVRVTSESAAASPARVSAPLRVAALSAFGVVFISLGAWSYLLRIAPQASQQATSEQEEIVVAGATLANAPARRDVQTEIARSETKVAVAQAIASPEPSDDAIQAKPVAAEPTSKDLVAPAQGVVYDALRVPELALPATPATRASFKTNNAPASSVVAKRTAPARPPRPAAATRAAAKTPPVPLSREVVLQVGSFEDARRAYALRNELGKNLAHVLVARVDQSRGVPRYSVRVVGFDSYRDVARAEDTIHALGHDSRRLSQPGPLQRFGRNVRPFLASVFGR